MNINLIVQTRHDFGLKTLLEISKELGVERGALLYHVSEGHLPRASTTVDEKPRKYYTSDEFEIIRNFYAENQNKKLAREAIA